MFSRGVGPYMIVLQIILPCVFALSPHCRGRTAAPRRLPAPRIATTSTYLYVLSIDRLAKRATKWPGSNAALWRAHCVVAFFFEKFHPGRQTADQDKKTAIITTSDQGFFRLGDRFVNIF